MKVSLYFLVIFDLWIPHSGILKKNKIRVTDEAYFAQLAKSI